MGGFRKGLCRVTHKKRVFTSKGALWVDGCLRFPSSQKVIKPRKWKPGSWQNFAKNSSVSQDEPTWWGLDWGQLLLRPHWRQAETTWDFKMKVSAGCGGSCLHSYYSRSRGRQISMSSRPSWATEWDPASKTNMTRETAQWIREHLTNLEYSQKSGK